MTEIHTMIEWLKNNRTSHSQEEEFMRRTAPHRAAWIRSSGTKTVDKINREYPRLHDFPGMVSVKMCSTENLLKGCLGLS